MVGLSNSPPSSTGSVRTDMSQLFVQRFVIEFTTRDKKCFEKHRLEKNTEYISVVLSNLSI